MTDRVRFRERYARRAEFGEGNSVRFRTRGHHGAAGDGGHSGHAGREIVRHRCDGKDHWVNIARLSLFAWSPDMSLEDLWAVPEEDRTSDPRTDKVAVHHWMPVPWLNAEWNLEWQHPDDHGRVESERRERDADGNYAGPRVPDELPEGPFDAAVAADGGEQKR